MDGAETLRSKVFGIHRNHDPIGSDHRRPTTTVEIWRAVDQHDIEIGLVLNKFPHSELRHSRFFRARRIVLSKILICWADVNSIELRWVNHLREVPESPRIVEEHRYRYLWREFLDGGGTKESLAHRALRISVNDKHAKSKSCICACQVKTCGTLPHAALLIDQTEGLGTGLSRLPLAILCNLAI